MRVNELARELMTTNRDLMESLHEAGVVVSNHAQSLTPEQVQQMKDKYAALMAAPPPPPLPPIGTPAPAPAPEAPPAAAAEPPPPPPPPEPVPAPAPAVPAVVHLHPPVIVKDFATQMGLKPNILIAELMKMNIFAAINATLDIKVAQKIAEKHGFKVEHEKKPEAAKPPPPPKPKKVEKEEEKERPDELLPRPPVVTFMGHVDHGKTSLLDHIRKTKVAAGEAGGITQHIGAYMVSVHDKMITFIDTPGHAAFTQMRARGANLTDIVVIVVAADEGIKPQTKEAIQHARAANVAIMVAINKIDLPTANLDRVMGQLQQEGLAPEAYGGKTIVCPVSATKGTGVDQLLELILLQAEIMELKAAPRKKAHGYVIEARLEPGMGPTATMLVKSGTLNVGDAIVCGDNWGRVKALINDRAVKVRTAGPSYAIQCLGLNAVPEAGAEFRAVANDREAREVSEERTATKRLDTLQTPRRGLSIDDLLNRTDLVEIRELPIVLKADVQGTLEAIQQSLADIKTTKISLRIVLAGVGTITANDVLLAKASNAIIIGFHVGPEDGVNKVARREGVEIRLYSIIYELLDEVRLAMAGRLDPILRENPMGQALVKQVFQLTKKGAVAGCLVKSGRISSRARVRIRRQGGVVYEGSLVSLKRFQNDASEVREGQECGLRLSDFHEYQVGDVIEAYEVQKIAQEL